VLSRSGAKLFELSKQEHSAISDLAGSKYRSWDWIYGWSPDYELTSNFQFQEIDCQIFIKVHRGILKDCSLKSRKIPEEDLGILMSFLRDCRHEADSIGKVIKTWNYPAISMENVIEEMVWSFF
jgi:lipoate-protein ligase A